MLKISSPAVILPLLFSAIVMVLAACGSSSSGGGEEEGGTSAGRSSSSIYYPPAVPDSVKITQFEASLNTLEDKLRINTRVAITTSSPADTALVLDSVRVLVDDKKVNTFPSSWSRIYSVDDLQFDISAEQYCKPTINVCVQAYVRGSSKYADFKDTNITKNVSLCMPSSSSEASSSSMTVLGFEKVTFDGKDTVELSTTTGIKLSGTVSGQSEADLYLTTNGFRSNNNNINIVTDFCDISTGCSSVKNFLEMMKGDISFPPSNTSQFAFDKGIVGVPGQNSSVKLSESAAQVEIGQYYLVRTAGDSKWEWDTSCYLVLVVEVGKATKVLVWKAK